MARIDAAVGKRVWQRRLELGRTQGELARTVGVSQYVLEEIETGRQRAGGHS